MANKRADGLKEREENEVAAKDLNNMWESQICSMQIPWKDSIFPDFSSECYNFLRQAGHQIPLDPTVSQSIVLPQSIAVDGKRIYVSDVINSVVYFFFDGNFEGKTSENEKRPAFQSSSLYTF